MYDFCIFVCMKAKRTNIELREDLVRDIIRLSEAKTKREAVEDAMENYVR